MFHDCEEAARKANEDRQIAEFGTLKLDVREIRILIDHEDEKISKAAKATFEKMRKTIPALRRMIAEAEGEEKADAMIRATFGET